jgi:hypothetical protein
MLLGRAVFFYLPPGVLNRKTERNQHIMKKAVKLAVRPQADNPNHHLWNNNGTWWCHLTVHWPDDTAERVRCSLKTRHLEEARLRRDRLFSRLEGGAA